MKTRKAKKAVRTSQRRGEAHPCGFIHFLKYSKLDQDFKSPPVREAGMGFLGEFQAKSALIPDGMGGIKEITTQAEFQDFLDRYK